MFVPRGKLLRADGSVALTANLPFGGFKGTGAGNGSASSDIAVYGQATGRVLPVSVSNWSSLPAGWLMSLGGTTDAAAGVTFAAGGATLSARDADSWWQSNFHRSPGFWFRNGAVAFDITFFLDTLGDWTTYTGALGGARLSVIDMAFGGGTEGSWITSEFYYDPNTAGAAKHGFYKAFKRQGETSGVFSSLTNAGATTPSQVALRLVKSPTLGFRAYSSVDGSNPSTETGGGSVATGSVLGPLEVTGNGTVTSAPASIATSGAFGLVLGTSTDSAGGVSAQLVNFTVNSAS